LIEWLDKTQDELARPEFSAVNGPDDLFRDAVLDGGSDGPITVVRRLGSGGTAVGFEVTRGGGSYALKVARTSELNDRLRAEAETIASLKHQNIVTLVGTVDVGSCNALLLWPFGSETLHDYLKREGALQLEFLARWGGQLLDAIEHLERESKSHRDIKPGNIAITDPYMHNGVFKNLWEVIEFYDAPEKGLMNFVWQETLTNYNTPLTIERNRENQLARLLAMAEDLPRDVKFTEEEEAQLWCFLTVAFTDQTQQAKLQGVENENPRCHPVPL
jgi:serine/threonine protein kinase